jgi:MYXO-CTERM domain-containing protein
VCTNGLCGGPPGCTKDAECPSQKPVCDTKSGACVECTDKNESKCTGAKPICDVATETCVPCDGDFGGDAKHACPTKDAPVCNAGSCGKCGSDADCKGHAGAICDLGSGTCVQGCHVDADCGASQWCDGVGGAAGVCHDKLDNGTHLPKAPPNVSTCSDAVGARVCKSGACDTKDDTCGLLPGDGPCDTDSQCRSSTCDVATHKCAPQLPTGCTSDAQCGANDYCKAGACTPKQPVGALCDAPNQCQSNMCESNKCDDVIASGNGLACAVQNAGSSDDDGAFAALGLAIAAAGLARRRRRR